MPSAQNNRKRFNFTHAPLLPGNSQPWMHIPIKSHSPTSGVKTANHVTVKHQTCIKIGIYLIGRSLGSRDHAYSRPTDAPFSSQLFFRGPTVTNTIHRVAGDSMRHSSAVQMQYDSATQIPFRIPRAHERNHVIQFQSLDPSMRTPAQQRGFQIGGGSVMAFCTPESDTSSFQGNFHSDRFPHGNASRSEPTDTLSLSDATGSTVIRVYSDTELKTRHSVASRVEDVSEEVRSHPPIRQSEPLTTPPYQPEHLYMPRPRHFDARDIEERYTSDIPTNSLRVASCAVGTSLCSVHDGFGLNASPHIPQSNLDSPPVINENASSLDFRHSPSTSHVCLWRDVNPCKRALTGDLQDLRNHLRVDHRCLVAGKQQEMCRWKACNKLLQRENMLRHIITCHLQIKTPCPVCGRMLSRGDVMTKHVRICPAGQQLPQGVQSLRGSASMCRAT